MPPPDGAVFERSDCQRARRPAPMPIALPDATNAMLTSGHRERRWIDCWFTAIGALDPGIPSASRCRSRHVCAPKVCIDGRVSAFRRSRRHQHYQSVDVTTRNGIEFFQQQLMVQRRNLLGLGNNPFSPLRQAELRRLARAGPCRRVLRVMRGTRHRAEDRVPDVLAIFARTPSARPIRATLALLVSVIKPLRRRRSGQGVLGYSEGFLLAHVAIVSK